MGGLAGEEHLADGETVRWSGRSSFARTAVWRLPSLLLGVLLLSVGADLWPVGPMLDSGFDWMIETAFGVPSIPFEPSDAFDAALVGFVDLMFCVVGAWYLWDYIDVLDANGRTSHFVTDRRILQVRAGVARSVPHSALTLVTADHGRWGGGVEAQAVGHRKPIRIAGIADTRGALAAVVAGMGR